jgi:hypothetical protein
MKDIVAKITEGKFNQSTEWWKVKCKKELVTKHLTFKTGEEYEASKINDNWWLIDAVGVNKDDFTKCFDKIEEIDIKADK